MLDMRCGDILVVLWLASGQLNWQSNTHQRYVFALELLKYTVPMNFRFELGLSSQVTVPCFQGILTFRTMFWLLMTGSRQMNFSGAALGGLTPNVTSVLYTINKGYAVGLAPVSRTTKVDNST